VKPIVEHEPDGIVPGLAAQPAGPIGIAGAEPLLAAEADILAHMNEEHADAVGLYATALKDTRPGPWRIVGIDPEGCDLLLEGEALRIVFAKPIATPHEAREELVRLTKEAREREV